MQIYTKDHFYLLFLIFFKDGFKEMIHFDWIITKARNKKINVFFANKHACRSWIYHGKTLRVAYRKDGLVEKIFLFPCYPEDINSQEWDFEIH